LKNPELTCPIDKTLPLAYDGVINGKNRSPRFKYMCPKTRRTKDGYVCSCEHPCTSSKCGYIQYEYPDDDIRAHQPIKQGSTEWNELYKIRTVVERDISMLKQPLVLGGDYLRNTVTSKSDFFAAGIAHLAVVIVAFRAGLLDKVRRVKSFAA